jgi:hypothetical protein
MARSVMSFLSTLLVLGGSAASAFEVKATIHSVDADARRVQFTAGTQERTVRVDAEAKIVDEQGQPLAAGLKAEALKPGAVVVLSIERVDNQPLIRGIRLGGTLAQVEPGTAQSKAQAKGAGQPAVDFKFPDTSNLVPLTDLGTGKYQGFEGGLYPDGTNTRPASHEAAGVALAREIKPRDAEGNPSPNGKIVLLGIGFSNTVQAFGGFMKVAADETGLNPRVLLINGAVGGMAAQMVQQADTGRGKQYWDSIDEKLKAAGVTRAQVQVVWIKETNPEQLNEGGFPKYIRDFQAQLASIVRIVHERFPNVKLAYFTSRTYGGWARPVQGRGRPGNSEPWSYESAFAYKWLIEDQLKGDPALNYDPARGPVKAPWMSWGPYIWANGEKPRSDGFHFVLTDFMATDQMHESPQGQLKVGKEILQFFKSDATTRTWFLKN